MEGVTIKSLFFLGLVFITFGSGGNEANAPAAKVSIIRFTQSICVTVNGNCCPNTEPKNTIKSAATLIVNWNSIKRCMFL